MQREGYYEYMKRRMREEDEKQGICSNFMLPSEMARRIRALEQKIEELENANVHVSRQEDR